MTAPLFPVIRLKPKANARAIRRGAPWVYDNELVLDRRTKKLAPGTVAVLEDAERAPLALVAVNPLSRITARVLDKDTGAQIDRAWFASRIARALEMRARLFTDPFYRLIHAEADGLPGVVVDRFLCRPFKRGGGRSGCLQPCGRLFTGRSGGRCGFGAGRGWIRRSARAGRAGRR